MVVLLGAPRVLQRYPLAQDLFPGDFEGELNGYGPLSSHVLLLRVATCMFMLSIMFICIGIIIFIIAIIVNVAIVVICFVVHL